MRQLVLVFDYKDTVFLGIDNVLVMVFSIPVIKNPEFEPPASDFLQLYLNGHCLYLIVMALPDPLADRINHATSSHIMRIFVITYPVDPNKISLILYGSGASQYLPCGLSGLRPVRHNDDQVIFPSIGITAPTRESEVIAGE
jgi:hypothetical protein